MAIAFRAAGTAKKVASGNLASVALPTGHTTNDILLLVVSGADNVSATQASYTLLAAGNNGTGQRLTVFWKRDGGSEVAPTVTHTSGSSAVAQIFAFSGANTGVSPFPTVGTLTSGTISGGSGTCTATGITPSFTNSAVIFVAGEADPTTDGLGANYYSAWSGTDPTFAEIGDAASLTGTKEASLGAAWGLTTDGAATGNRTVTIGPGASSAAGGTNLGILLELADASPTSPAAAVSLVADPRRGYRHRTERRW